jgi:hypothetical protein
VIPVTSNNGLLAAYGVKHSDGTVRVLLINKNPTLTAPVAIDFSSFTPTSSVKVYSYGIQQDNAAKTGVGSPGIAASTSNGGSVKSLVSVGPYSATVFVFTPKK